MTRHFRRSFWLLRSKKTRDSQGQKQRDQLACGLVGESGSGKDKVKIRKRSQNWIHSKGRANSTC